jgi:P27 family predicted phage terminase small subunit
MARIKEIMNWQKKLQGHKRFVKNTPEVKPITRLWITPKFLNEQGREFWTEAGRVLVKAKGLTELDKQTFSMLAASYGTVAAADEALMREGYTVPGRGETVVKHPLVAVRKNAMSEFVTLAQRFGLTPYDRNKIDLPVDSNPQDKARLFLFGGNK